MRVLLSTIVYHLIVLSGSQPLRDINMLFSNIKRHLPLAASQSKIGYHQQQWHVLSGTEALKVPIVSSASTFTPEISTLTFVSANSSHKQQTWFQKSISKVKTADVIEIDDFSYGYWVRLAQARAMAKILENATAPEVEIFSGLMLPAVCNHDGRCHDFVKMCADDEANSLLRHMKQHVIIGTPENVSTYERRIMSQCGFKAGTDWKTKFEPKYIPSPPKPIFHCNHYYNNTSVITHIRIVYMNEDNGKFSKDFLPRVFVLEWGDLQKNGEMAWELTKLPVHSHWLYRFKTTPGHSYRLRVTAVSPKHVYPPMTSELISVYKSSTIVVKKPNHLRMVNVTVNAEGKPSALLRWESGSGSNASCDQDAFIMDEDVFKVERKTGNDAFWVRFRNLEYQRTYHVRVIEKMGNANEAEIASDLNIPSCLELRGYSFDLCPPPPPSNIRIEKPTEHSFQVSWDAPNHVNETNRIFHYDLTVEWISTFSPAPSFSVDSSFPSVPIITSPFQRHPRRFPYFRNSKVFSRIIPGTVTSVDISNVTMLRGKFKISIIAFGVAGASETAKDFVNFQGSPQQSPRSIVNILIVVFSLTGVFSLSCVVKHVHCRRQTRKRRAQIFENYEKKTFECQQNLWKDTTKWEIDCSSLTLGDAIGQGHFGIVRVAIWNNNGMRMKVAVKTLQDGVNGKAAERLLEEFEILQSLEPHPNIVGLKGVVTRHVPQPLLVVEYCDGGDLRSYLRKFQKLRGSSGKCTTVSTLQSTSSPELTSGEEIPTKMRVLGNESFSQNFDSANLQNMALTGLLLLSPDSQSAPSELILYARQIAVGMEYLSNNKIVHRDLATRNILISNNNGKNPILKISDFGLSRDVYEQSWYKKKSNDKIPVKWHPMECIFNDIYTTKSDVWSFGILLWEIFTYGGNPYPGVDNMQVFHLIRNGYRMPRPDICPADVYQLMCQCWDDDPHGRPDFTKIRLFFEENFLMDMVYVVECVVVGQRNCCKKSSKMDLSWQSSVAITQSV